MTAPAARRRQRQRVDTPTSRFSRLPGIRWVPVPLALLAGIVGWLVYGAVLGQSAAAQSGRHGYQAGGLQLSVQQMEWMSNDMTGEGPQSAPPGFAMDPGMMPGMQSANDNRLQFELTLKNVTSRVQRYAMSEFRAIGPGGQSWPEKPTAGQNTYATEGDIEPSYSVTVDVYFDIPAKQSTGLSIEWSRGGDKVDLPVETGGAPMTPMNMP